MAVASAWRRAWMRSRGSGGGRSLHPTCGNSTTAGSIYTAGTISATSSMPLPTSSPVVEENAEEELEEDMAVASAWPWRRAWLRPRGSGEHVANGGGSLLPPTGGDSTTTSGTTTTYTATSGSAGEPRPRDLHPFPSTAPVVEENTEEELYVAKELAKDKAKKLEHIKVLVQEFRGDDRSALEMWLSELDAGWVLHLAGTHESSRSVVVTSHGFQFLAESWILALRKIAESILTCLDGWYSQSQKQDHDEGTSNQPSASEFAELVKAAVLKMLPFVDIAATAKTTDKPGALATAEKLQALIDMHEALSMVSQNILSLQVESTDEGKMGDLLSADLTKLDEAIWATIVEIMNIVMAWTWTDDGGGSSGIHKVTNSIVSYTKVLWTNYGSVNRVLHDAVLRGEFVSENENVSHVSNLIMEMVSSLEIRPSTMSSLASFPDESLRFLFLINNLYYLLKQFRTIWRLDFAMVPLNSKIDDHINNYLHVSWAPVLKCLQDPVLMPCCLIRCSSPPESPLPKFESKFQLTCATQKLWKVPDPKMRRRLRKAIVDNVIPVFTQFLEDNSIVTPRFTPRKLEKILGELFEG